MTTVQDKPSTTTRKPLTKSQRVYDMNHRLYTIHDDLAETLEGMIGIENGPFKYGELDCAAEAENEVRARLERQEGPTEFQELGKIFVILDDLLNGPECRQYRLKKCQVHMELWEATYGGLTEAERKQQREDALNMTPEEREAHSEAWEARVRKEVKRQERIAARASRETVAA